MGARLGRAIGDRDALATWLLASSHWPDYLTSRGLGHKIALWNAEVGATLERVTDPALATTRKVYRALADGRSGLPVLGTLFSTSIPIVLNEFEAWTPAVRATKAGPRPRTQVRPAPVVKAPVCGSHLKASYAREAFGPCERR